MFDILVVGEINPDLILSGDVEPAFNQVEKLVDAAVMTIGSSSAIFACGAARLGLQVAFLGICGDDVFGKFMLDEMSKRGVNIENVIIVPGGSTGMGVILTRGADRAIFTYPGLMPTLQAGAVNDQVLQQARHLHVASYYLQTALQPGLPGLFRRAHSFGLSTSLDTNFDPSGQWLDLESLLNQTDIFLPNETEACALARSKDVNLSAEKLAGNVRTLAVKLGAQGALAIQNQKKVTAASIPVKVVDTVGAGDSFDAGFLYGVLHNWPLEKSLRLATVCGALSTRSAGGTTAQATLEEAGQYEIG
jgi:sugar/nucleoside kinase (ribokinase family)